MKISLWLGLLIISVGWASISHAQETPSPLPSPQASPTVSAALQELEKNQEAIAAKKNEIASLDEKIRTLSSQRDTTQAQAALIAQQLTRLRGQLEQAQLELKQTQLNIKVVDDEKKTTESKIDELATNVQEKRKQLRSLIRTLYDHEQLSLIRVFFDTGSLSEMLTVRAAYQEVQDQQVALLKDLKADEQELTVRQASLTQQQQDLGELQKLLATQQQGLSQQQSEQAKFLQAKKAEQLEYDHRLAEAKQARQEIESNIFTLKNTGVTLKLNEATDMARYASKLTGVRAALLLGVLKVETNLGTNLGNGKFPDDMQPASRDAFLRITKKLNLDPNAAPISARPRSYQGWGGAMGPGQFMPATWETIEGRVGQLMQKTQPNPYELTDAFVATALFLADRGATSSSGEYEAVNRYLAGPNWQRFTWYGDRVLAVAKEYEKEGL